MLLPIPALRQKANMKTRLMLSVLAICAWIVLLSSHAPGDPQKEPESVGKPEFKWHVPQRPLSAILGELAKASGQDPEDYRIYRRNGGVGKFSEKGSVTAIQAEGKTYAIAVQTVEPATFPGIFAQQIVLLTPEGRILDRLQCEINSRYGRTKVETLPKPDADGARIVIRFEGHKFPFPNGKQNWWHNWHTIVYHGKARTFHENDTRKPGIWNEKGLCRMKVVDDKLSILFPDLQSPEK